jgi:SAM-dependent methyltransferase
MMMTLDELNRIAASVGERQGWDFSRVRDGRDPVPWDYVDVVRNYLRPSDRVLDVGTGGGEKFLSLAPYFGSGIGIDISPEMIETARHNRTATQVENVSFEVMKAETLQFAETEFDVVLNRHSDVAVGEVVRVLRPGGYFITQSVGHRNTANILAAFGWTPASFGDDWWSPASEMAGQFRQYGCHIRALAEYDVPYWFCDVESLVFWLKAVPLPEDFEVERHWQSVNRILEECRTERGIETNEHRELLIVQKGI